MLSTSGRMLWSLKTCPYKLPYKYNNKYLTTV
jgi:hypothetical protein